MNAIKRPVHFYAQADREMLWSIRDDDRKAAIEINLALAVALAKIEDFQKTQ